MDDITTTFKLDRDLHWRLKKALTDNRKTLKEVSTDLVKRYVCDHLDRLQTQQVEFLNRFLQEDPGMLTWTEVKRRWGLDATHCYDEQHSSERHSDTE